MGRLKGGEMELELIHLFEGLSATADQMEYPMLFGSLRGGWVTEDANAALEIKRGEAERAR